MKNILLTLMVFILGLTTALAQDQNSSEPKRNQSRIMLTVTTKAGSETDSLTYVSYSMHKKHPDSIAQQPMRAEIVWGQNHPNHFFLQAASGSISKAVDLLIVFYGKNGETKQIIKAKQAHIVSFTSGISSGGLHGGFSDFSFTVKTPVLIVDGIKM